MAQKWYFSKKFYNPRCIRCTVKIMGFEKKRKIKDRQYYRSNILCFLSLFMYVEERYKSMRGENVYLTNSQMQGNFIIFFIDTPCCQCWLHHTFQISILKDICYKWYWNDSGWPLPVFLTLLNNLPFSSLYFMWKRVHPT